jgi:hypothetical protein
MGGPGSGPVKDWFEKNPSKTQFYLTIVILFTTVVFSYLSLVETRKQYAIAKGALDNANQQLKFAKDQYKAQTAQRTEDMRLAHLKDIAISKKDSTDSVRNVENDFQQKRYNEFQTQINSQQLKINRQQLAAIQTQAKVAAAQFDFQKIQSANQFEQNRPIFSIDSVHVNKLNSAYNPTLSFHVNNRGVRTPHVDSTVIATWNINSKCSRVEKHFTNIDLKDASFITGMQVYQDCLDNKNTIYYLNVIYIDTYDGKSKSKHRFFRYTIKADKSVTTVDVGDFETLEFVKYLKMKEKTEGRLL